MAKRSNYVEPSDYFNASMKKALKDYEKAEKAKKTTEKPESKPKKK